MTLAIITQDRKAMQGALWGRLADAFGRPMFGHYMLEPRGRQVKCVRAAEGDAARREVGAGFALYALVCYNLPPSMNGPSSEVQWNVVPL